MTDELIRVDEQGNPLNDTWSDYGRLHRYLPPVFVEEGLDWKYQRVRLTCTRCRQFRLVWHVVATDAAWGCPKVPLRYRLGLVNWPLWSVNEPPPWVKR